MSATNPTVRPELADVYFDWGTEASSAPQPSTGSTVAVAATSDWGPVNTPVALGSYDGSASTDPTVESGYLGVFGDSDTELSRAVKGTFTGQGYNGFGGAGTIIAYRQATSAAAAATITLQNTASTPAAALRLTARYPGTRANALRVTVQAGATLGENELLVLDGALVVEKYDHVATDLASLIAEINLLSGWFTATVLVDGVALALVSSAPVSGGNDGAVLTGADWTNTFNAYDRQRWQYFAAYNLIDPTIRASIVAWCQDRNTHGARCMAIFGGAIDEALATAIARSQAINDYDFINLGEGRLHLTDENRDCSTAEFVARYAGARAFRGESAGDIFVRFANVELLSGASLSEQSEALAAGVVVFSRDTDVNAPVFIREAVNTYTDDSLSPIDAQTGVKEHPVALYRVIKNIAIQQGIELEIGDWARGGEILGDLPVDDKTRAIVIGRIQLAYSNREAAQVVQPGWTVAVAGTPSDDDDFVQYVHGFHPTRSLRQILNTARIG